MRQWRHYWCHFLLLIIILCIINVRSQGLSNLRRSDYLIRSNVILYSSSRHTVTGEHEALLQCQEPSTIDLKAVEIDKLIASLYVVNCSIAVITRQTAFHLISQGVKLLYFKDSKLQILEEALAVYQQSLVSLYLVNCSIGDEPLTFPIMRAMKTLELSGLGLSAPAEGSELLEGLTVLDLSHNQLAESNIAGVWPTVTSLLLTHNKFKKIFDMDELLESFPMLSEVDLSHNKITQVVMSKESSDGEKSMLHRLSLSHNNITNLTWINDWSAECLSTVRMLDFSHNKIEHITPTELSHLGHLMILNLSHNYLTSLDSALNGVVLPLRLELEGNAWRCDCSLVWMRVSEEFDEQTLPLCQEPESFKQFTINDFPSPSAC